MGQYKEILELVEQVHRQLEIREPDAVSSLTQKIIGAHSVFLLGAGRSGLIAKCFAMRLMHCGIASYAAGECGTPRPRNGDLAIILSASGETPSLVAISRRLRETEVEMTLISARSDATLSTLCDNKIILTGCENHQRQNLLPMGSLFENAAFLLLESTVAETIASTGIDQAFMQDNHTILE